MVILENKKIEIANLSDMEVVAAILKGNNRQEQRKLQEELYDRYAGKIYHKCRNMVRNDEVAKDLSHDIIVKVFLKLDRFRGDSSFYSWVIVIAYNHCITYLEKEKRLKVEGFDDHSFEITAEEEGIEEKILQEARLEQLEENIKKLHDAERLILMMRYQDGISVKEIATTLNIGESAVKMRLKRSRDRLAHLINGAKS